MSNRSLKLDDRLYQYLQDHSLRENEIQRELREVTTGMEMGRMQIAPEQGQFMALLVELIGAANLIEVGTFTGYSTLCMAQALPEHGRIVCCDISEEWTDIAKSFWRRAGIADRIHLHLRPAVETLDHLISNGESGRYDLAFIDADKPAYGDYYERCLKLLRPGGLILFDNMLWGGAVADANDDDPDTIAIRDLNDLLHDDQRVSISLIPVGDGLTLARKHTDQ